MAGDPAPGDPVDRSADDQVGNERQAEHDDDELPEIDRLEHDHLVEHVHHDAKQDHPQDAMPAFAQQVTAPLRMPEDVPQVRGLALIGVQHAVADGVNRRHHRLEHEPEGKGPVEAVDQIGGEFWDTWYVQHYFKRGQISMWSGFDPELRRQLATIRQLLGLRHQTPTPEWALS